MTRRRVLGWGRTQVTPGSPSAQPRPRQSAALRAGPHALDEARRNLASTSRAARRRARDDHARGGSVPRSGQASFRPALETWARAEVRCALLAPCLGARAPRRRGCASPGDEVMTSQEFLALKLRARLGPDAASPAGTEASLTSTAASQASLAAGRWLRLPAVERWDLPGPHKS